MVDGAPPPEAPQPEPDPAPLVGIPKPSVAPVPVITIAAQLFRTPDGKIAVTGGFSGPDPGGGWLHHDAFQLLEELRFQVYRDKSKVLDAREVTVVRGVDAAALAVAERDVFGRRGR